MLQGTNSQLVQTGKESSYTCTCFQSCIISDSLSKTTFCFFTKDKEIQTLEKSGYEFNVMGQSSGSKYAHISLWDSNDVFLDDFSTLDAFNSQGSVTTEICFS